MEIYTDQQATDEVVRYLVCKLRRLCAVTYDAIMVELPEEARAALGRAEARAESLRNADRRAGVQRTYPAMGDGRAIFDVLDRLADAAGDAEKTFDVEQAAAEGRQARREGIEELIDELVETVGAYGGTLETFMADLKARYPEDVKLIDRAYEAELRRVAPLQDLYSPEFRDQVIDTLQSFMKDRGLQASNTVVIVHHPEDGGFEVVRVNPPQAAC